MRQTLRRSCAACAKSKHSCDLGTPRCSRCIKRRVQCIYANQPLTAPSTPSEGSNLLSQYRFASVDPFDSYPHTRLPRQHVHRLIHSFLHKIAFEYYPLDLNPTSNPFLISWWPLALGDPALFHVSLQTACLDEELLAQKGFQTSELLMADSVALLRRKLGDTSLAVQDGTMNSVITLAAIEFGKGNTKVSEMHIEGAKRLVDLRGGINAVRQTSPLTARMVSWVSLLVTGQPQFTTQTDVGIGHGIPPIPEWHLNPPLTHDSDFPELDNPVMDPEVRNVLLRLRTVFHRAQQQSPFPFPSTRLHDLTCFVVHRLLLTAPPDPQAALIPSPPTTIESKSEFISGSESLPQPEFDPLSESLRHATLLYMFILQGPTYYSHAVIFSNLLAKFVTHLSRLPLPKQIPIHQADGFESVLCSGSIYIWLVAVGLAASAGTGTGEYYEWFVERARDVVRELGIGDWVGVFERVRRVMWLEMGGRMEERWRMCWDRVFRDELRRDGGRSWRVGDIGVEAGVGCV